MLAKLVNPTPDVLAEIKQVPHFRDGIYANLDIPLTLEYFRRRFVAHCPSTRKADVIADIGCGYGWLAMAFAAYTPCRVVAVDLDAARLEAGQKIAKLLGLADRIDWRVGSLCAIPMANGEADVTYCVEVLEHIDRDRRGFAELDRVTSRYLILTTPNAAFPVVQHDTVLPFCHWLPMPLRDAYAHLAGRAHMQQGNRFWYPWDLRRGLGNFRRTSRFMHFPRVQAYFDLYPYYLPYGSGEQRSAPSKAMRSYYRMAAWFGGYSHLVLQNLAGTFERVL
jgi:SAM-dependent methyltransferase